MGWAIETALFRDSSGGPRSLQSKGASDSFVVSIFKKPSKSVSEKPSALRNVCDAAGKCFHETGMVTKCVCVSGTQKRCKMRFREI